MLAILALSVLSPPTTQCDIVRDRPDLRNDGSVIVVTSGDEKRFGDYGGLVYITYSLNSLRATAGNISVTGAVLTSQNCDHDDYDFANFDQNAIGRRWVIFANGRKYTGIVRFYK